MLTETRHHTNRKGTYANGKGTYADEMVVSMMFYDVSLRLPSKKKETVSEWTGKEANVHPKIKKWRKIQ